MKLKPIATVTAIVSGVASSWTKLSLPQHRRSRRSCDFSLSRFDDFFMQAPNDTSVVKVLGVCGGIGSGKSSACNLLVTQLNCLSHIDSDSIAHSVYEPNSTVIQDVIGEFGMDLLLPNGEIDRKKLGSIVFANNHAMKRLERIVWPHVKAKIHQEIAFVKANRDIADGKVPIIVVEAAVLLDADWNELLDGVWLVVSSHDIAMERLQLIRGLSFDEAKKRILAQATRRGIGNLQQEVDSGVVSAVVKNDGTLQDLKQCLEENLRDPSSWYPNQ
jgi:dephospho-CoA kinase